MPVFGAALPGIEPTPYQSRGRHSTTTPWRGGRDEQLAGRGISGHIYYLRKPADKQLELFPKKLERIIESSIFTQNALPSKWEPVLAEGVGVVGRDDGESVLLAGQLEALGDGVVQSHRLVERHVGPAVVVSLVDTPR